MNKLQQNDALLCSRFTACFMYKSARVDGGSSLNAAAVLYFCLQQKRIKCGARSVSDQAARSTWINAICCFYLIDLMAEMHAVVAAKDASQHMQPLQSQVVSVLFVANGIQDIFISLSLLRGSAYAASGFIRQRKLH
jgi:hypothetical protein